MDRRNETITITEKQLMDAMLDLAVGDNSKLKELTDKIPMFTLLFPIIGCELWKLLEARANNSWWNTNEKEDM